MMRQPSLFARRLLYWISMAVGLVLAIVPLPGWLDPVRPDLALLAMIYFILTSPRIAGLGYALGFLLVGYITHKLQLQMRMFPILQQAAIVLVLLGLYHFIVFWIDGLTGHGYTAWVRWLPVVSGALLWPLVVAVGDSLTRRSA